MPSQLRCACAGLSAKIADVCENARDRIVRAHVQNEHLTVG